MAFSDRLKTAAGHAKVEYSQTAIARSLGESKQKVDRWFGKGEPSPAALFNIADRWGVDARWLATGKGDMLGRQVPQGLPAHEEELLERYRGAAPLWRLALQLLSSLAVEDQAEAASDVNVVLARIFGKKPQDVRPIGNQRMRDILKSSAQGWPPREPVKKNS
jgi:transcriptional regulator with XRE-family HTH domain